MSNRPEDPVVYHGRREAVVVLCIWLAAMAYTVGYVGLFGYGRTLEGMTFVLGFPDWVFWGIIAPWTTCVVLSWIIAIVLMRDADLGREADADDVEAGDGS